MGRLVEENRRGFSNEGGKQMVGIRLQIWRQFDEKRFPNDQQNIDACPKISASYIHTIQKC